MTKKHFIALADVIREHQRLTNFNNQNNAYNGGAITIAVGGASFNCILTNLSIAADMNSFNYASFSLSFTIIPPRA